MLKFLIILFLVSYVVFRLGGFIFKLFSSGISNSQRQGNFNSQSHQQHSKRKAPGSNLHIDHVPQGKKGQNKNYNDGEYVDYEELK